MCVYTHVFLRVILHPLSRKQGVLTLKLNCFCVLVVFLRFFWGGWSFGRPSCTPPRPLRTRTRRRALKRRFAHVHIRSHMCIYTCTCTFSFVYMRTCVYTQVFTATCTYPVHSVVFDAHVHVAVHTCLLCDEHRHSVACDARANA